MCSALYIKCVWDWLRKYVTFNGRSGGNAGLSFGRPRRKSFDEIITHYNCVVICIPFNFTPSNHECAPWRRSWWRATSRSWRCRSPRPCCPLTASRRTCRGCSSSCGRCPTRRPPRRSGWCLCLPWAGVRMRRILIRMICPPPRQVLCLRQKVPHPLLPNASPKKSEKKWKQKYEDKC